MTLQLAVAANLRHVDSLLESLGVDFTRNSLVVSVSVSGTEQALEVVDAIRPNISDLEIRNGTMDQVFLRLTSEGEIR